MHKTKQKQEEDARSELEEKLDVYLIGDRRFQLVEENCLQLSYKLALCVRFSLTALCDGLV